MALKRILDYLFVVYFGTHIPITLLFDLQVLFGDSVHPQVLRDITASYVRDFKDTMMQAPPTWFLSFIYCELFLQLPFFFVATYAFWKGACRWIRLPAIVYSTHVATTMVPILSHLIFHDFSKSELGGPSTLKERMTLCAIYSPYLFIPLLILFRMLFSREFSPVSHKSGKQKQK